MVDKSGLIDPEIMRPKFRSAANDEISVLAEMAVSAARDAIDAGASRPGSTPCCARANLQRAYPAIAIEVQEALGIEGFAFDMNVACSSATFGIKAAADFVAAGSRAPSWCRSGDLLGPPELPRPRQPLHLRRRGTAVVVERAERARREGAGRSSARG